MVDFKAAMTAAKMRQGSGQQAPAAPAQGGEGQEMEHEKVEDAGWQKIIELCDSGDPQALEAIKQIATEEMKSQMQEEQGMSQEAAPEVQE
jgi:hypothetical protein